MEIAGEPVPVALLILAGLAVLGIAVVLVDLARSEVRHLPKWAWALIIALVSFPLGALAYLLVGRVPATEATSTAGTVDAGDAAGREDDGRGGPALELREDVPAREPARPETDLLAATRGLRKAYGETVALDDVDLAVPRGRVYGLIGPNGAGKTTLLAILAGLRRPDVGSIDLAVTRRELGVLVDAPQFEPWLTAREVVDLSRTLTAPHVAVERVDEALAEVGLAEAADRRAGGFSRGMLQRLGLAAALVGDPAALLLDEPSSALDPAGRREVLDLIGRLARRKTVILSTHVLADVQQVADVVGVIDHGRLRFQGPLSELLARTSAVYALQVRPPCDALVAALRARDWARAVDETAPGRIRLVAEDPAAAERDVPRLLAEHGAELVAFTPAADLEAAFLELTG